MALQASGSISASDISREFGQTTNISFGAYRISQTPIGSNLTLPLDTDIPGPGQPIKFSNFYSKRLNIVVNCAPTNTIRTRITARTRYNNNNEITVIGGFKGKPLSTNGSKVWIHTNGILGSNVNNTTSNGIAITRCSLLVGSWENDTTLNVDVGINGTITGSGGNGGAGGRANLPSNNKSAENGFPGFNGTSALGIDYTNNSVVISNRGRIQEGAGGGGGGGGAWNENRRRNEADVIYGSGGSGGGGGHGYPSGTGGGGGSGRSGSGNSGGTGNLITSGNGGAGRSDARSAGGGGGGGGRNGLGGSGVASGGTGGNGTGNNGGAGGNSGAFGGNDGRTANPDRGGGAGGLNGFAVVVNGNGSNISITGNSLIGNQINNTVPT
jgi:hypothetical protein